MNWEAEGTVHDNCVVFFKVNEEWGGLSNLNNDFPRVRSRANGERIRLDGLGGILGFKVG
jgi:hypothetical protein